MIELTNTNLDLEHDPAAQRYLKVSTVDVEFADVDGSLRTLEGNVTFHVGDALLTGIEGERWPVELEHFLESYDPEPPTLAGRTGRYRKKPTAVVLAKRMPAAFQLAMPSGELLQGNAGDWLTQYKSGSFGVVRDDIFTKTYRLAK